ncbi:hypothetical protein OG394_19910 [Kribbella sp. NBC_01245]|uniref:alpha/beta fold hydrolase n=1 Tax=Kribbella sp. NBC_01245 TaxID=2903578 RepID=UPI002E2CE24C|nr:hypothetical protein [Kribbella sp. NBC_01245]
MSRVYRSFILPESMRTTREFMDVGLRTTTRVLVGADDPILRPEFVHGHESHVDDLTIDYMPNAGHFLVDDRPDEVITHALDLFQK